MFVSILLYIKKKKKILFLNISNLFKAIFNKSIQFFVFFKESVKFLLMKLVIFFNLVKNKIIKFYLFIKNIIKFLFTIIFNCFKGIQNLVIKIYLYAKDEPFLFLLYCTVAFFTLFGYYIYFTKIAPYQNGYNSSFIEEIPRPKWFSTGNLPPIQRPPCIENAKHWFWGKYYK